jgi:hypothetical protein
MYLGGRDVDSVNADKVLMLDVAVDDAVTVQVADGARHLIHHNADLRRAGGGKGGMQGRRYLK